LLIDLTNKVKSQIQASFTAYPSLISTY